MYVEELFLNWCIATSGERFLIYKLFSIQWLTTSPPPPPRCQTATRITVRYWIIRVQGNQLNLSFSINYKPWEQFKPNLTNQNLGFYAINLIFTFPFTIGKILVKNNGYLSRPGLVYTKVLMQGKLFQRCTHFLYCSVFSLGGKLNVRRMSKPDRESIFTKIIY